MPVLLFYSNADSVKPWQEGLAISYPELEIRNWPDWGVTGDAEFALVWHPPRGELAKCKNLKAIFSLGAGIDHIINDDSIPREIPVIRLVDDGLTSGMTEYVTMHVLYHHRYMNEYTLARQSTSWLSLPQVPAWKRTIGIMGVGVLGSDVVNKLKHFGFNLIGWSRTNKNIDGMTGFTGATELDDFLSQSEILVCLLPLTSETQGILNKNTLAKLPHGSSLINVGRGNTLIEEDLLASLDSGHIRSATLDVFQTEPLPGDHPFWSHPKIFITPHIASITSADTYASVLALNIKKILNGEEIEHQVDRKLGY